MAITAGGVAAGGLAGYAISSQMEKGKAVSMKDGAVDSRGNTILTSKGSINLDPQDDIVAGTNLFSGGTDMTETNKILKENVKESRMLREQNEFLINKLIRTTGELSLNNA